MLKKRDLHEVPALYQLMSHPEVYPYVRQKAESSDAFYFITKQTMEAEERGQLISRTIVDEYNQPIGTITLFDIEQNHGFLATWIGKPYFGKGYNREAKEQFFDELFLHASIDTIFMKVRKTNTRSLKAVLKIPYVTLANSIYPQVYEQINPNEAIYDLFAISKEHYYSYQQFYALEAEATDHEVG